MPFLPTIRTKGTFLLATFVVLCCTPDATPVCWGFFTLTVLMTWLHQNVSILFRVSQCNGINITCITIPSWPQWYLRNPTALLHLQIVSGGQVQSKAWLLKWSTALSKSSKSPRGHYCRIGEWYQTSSNGRGWHSNAMEFFFKWLI